MVTRGRLRDPAPSAMEGNVDPPRNGMWLGPLVQAADVSGKLMRLTALGGLTQINLLAPWGRSKPILASRPSRSVKGPVSLCLSSRLSLKSRRSSSFATAVFTSSARLPASIVNTRRTFTSRRLPEWRDALGSIAGTKPRPVPTSFLSPLGVAPDITRQPGQEPSRRALQGWLSHLTRSPPIGPRGCGFAVSTSGQCEPKRRGARPLPQQTQPA
jgi:hypothetical protein